MIFLISEIYDGEIKLNIVKDGYYMEYTLAFIHCTFPKSKLSSGYHTSFAYIICSMKLANMFLVYNMT